MRPWPQFQCRSSDSGDNDGQMEGYLDHLSSPFLSTLDKVPIPRLDAPERVVHRKRNRVLRACNDCRTRRIKCSGEQPICAECKKTGGPCIYEQTRKNRLDQVTERNAFLTSVLEEVSMRVSEEDRQRISSALEMV
ncbi:hypothetical protein B0J11DRAFT_297866 [Dendryphion nanum]|uniref:Zn(2)-C6 fungal-type domain-containing protein n=1 Tax=Dendryphion nanum TaxID=256645 RepID=A0A9P9ILW5_9PLEO|nr:hypothetical protein B0J11DRAFT_297866 [Dendryphion nanum]